MTENSISAQASILTKVDLSVIEEAATVLFSAAKHNSNLGRTIMAHVQQDRAERLQNILRKFAQEA